MLFGCIPLVKTKHLWSLKCRHCAHEIDVKGGDVDRAVELNRHALRYEAGKLSQEEFVRLANDLRLDCVELIKRVQTKVKCPSCGEEAPGTFACCWKCGTEIPGTAAADEKGDAKGLPGNNDTLSPFGGMRL